MRFKTRLIVTFLVILILPPALIGLTFLVMGYLLIKNLPVPVTPSLDMVFYITSEIFQDMLVAQTMLYQLFFATILIFLLIGLLLIHWFNRGVFQPINQLNVAMQNIADGDLEYIISGDERGEIGELYHNYEEMRLRLKESIVEKMEAEKQNREMISNITHDLKTPITAIKGYIEGIADGVADTPEKMDRYVRTIYNKANEMDRLINELTFYTGIGSNRMPYNFRKINIADYFGDCIEEVGLDLESKGIRLHYSNLVSPETTIISDPEQLKRALGNIINNSVKYIDRNKAECEISIRILDEHESIRIEIEDNGRGIPARELGRIFERFYRSDASRNSAKGGSGIGLSIVKKIVEDHGGYVWATSCEDEGTCMHIVFRKYTKEVIHE